MTSLVRAGRWWLIGSLISAVPVTAHNSAYSILGIGFPVPPWSVVARAMGGGIAAVDPQSALNPGAVGLVRQLSVQGASMQEFRRYSIDGTTASGLTQTRFPYLSVTAPLGPEFGYSLGFTAYAATTCARATRCTVLLGGP